MIITLAMLIVIHEEVVRETGESNHILDKGLLESTVNIPYQTFGGVELFPTIESKAARLFYGIVSNQIFENGNKRTGTVAFLYFLKRNGIEIKYEEDELIELALKVANNSEKYNIDFIIDWLNTHKQ